MASIDGEPSSGFLTIATYSTPAATNADTTPTSTSPTASTTPTRGAESGGQQQSNDDYSSGLSSSAKKVVICTTTIGGTFILALLIYALWRKRRGGSYSEIVRFQPQSDQRMTLNAHLTALPIYRHEPFSVTSSRHSMAGGPQPPGEKPSNESSLAKGLRSQPTESLVPSRPQTSRSGKTLRQKSSPTFLNATPLRPSQREREKVYHRPSEGHHVMGHSIRSKTSYHNMKQVDRPSTAPNQTPFTSDVRPALHLKAPTESEAPDRWSWTNSQAPPTPRIVPPGRLSFSARSIRSISSWMTAGSKKKEDAPNPPRRNLKRKISRQELLKNQAVQPILGPPPARNNLSKSHPHRRVGSLSTIFRPNPESLVPAPLSPKLEEPSAGTRVSFEMTPKT